MKITVGCHVEVYLIDRESKRDFLSFDIVPDEAADFEHGFLGVSSPLGKALIGEKAGITIPYLKGDIYAIEVLCVVPSVNQPDEDAVKKRQDRMKRTIHEVEHTNAVVFASSFSGKWGDYDPDSLPKGDKVQGSGKNL